MAVKLNKNGGIQPHLEGLSGTILEMIVVGDFLCRTGQGRRPTYREMGRWLGVNQNTVVRAVAVLHQRGLIRKTGRNSGMVIQPFGDTSEPPVSSPRSGCP